MQPTTIQKHGFTWLSLPRENILPLTLLEKTKENLLQRITAFLFSNKESADAIGADLFTLFPKPKRGLLPKIGKPADAAFFKGYDILNVNASVSVQTLKNIPLIATSQLSSEVKSNSKLLYSFKNVKHISIDNEVLLETHLNVTEPNDAAPGFIEKLKEGCIYVVTEILQTTEFYVQDATDLTVDNTVDIKTIQNYLDLKARLAVGNESSMRESHKGEKPLTFALKAAKILYHANTKNFSLYRTKLKIVKGKNPGRENEEMLETDTIMIK